MNSYENFRFFKIGEKKEKLNISRYGEFIILISLGISLILVSLYNYYLQPWTLDDAYIAFRYAENFSEGKGIVYNEGEYVEGYTCFLWVLLLAGLHKIGLDLPITSKILGVLFTFITIFLMSCIHKIIKGTHWLVSVAGVLILGSMGAFTSWAMSGMETSMTAFLIFLSILLFGAFISRNKELLSGYFLVGVVIALAVMSRPDAGIILPVLVFCSFLHAFKEKQYFNPIFIILGFSLVFIPYFIWRYNYYGWLLPNTFYVKVGSSKEQIKRGLTYAFYFLKGTSLIWAPFIMLQIFPLKTLEKRGYVVFSMSLAVLLNMLYVISVGGDCMPAHRFYTPITPLLVAVSAYSLFLPGVSYFRSLLLVIIIVIFNLWQLKNDPYLYERIVADVVAERGKETGLWLRDNVPPNSLLATNTAGSVAYYSHLKIIDMLGLNDEHIAHREIKTLGKGFAGHEKGDGKYVLSRKPDYIMFGSATGNKEPRFVSDREMAVEAEFQKNYVYKQYILPSGRALHIYERKK
ncbi:MAG: ArnT family glycosyltransferase [Candidatus Hydrogenedens sp.]